MDYSCSATRAMPTYHTGNFVAASKTWIPVSRGGRRKRSERVSRLASSCPSIGRWMMLATVVDYSSSLLNEADLALLAFTLVWRCAYSINNWFTGKSDSFARYLSTDTYAIIASTPANLIHGSRQSLSFHRKRFAAPPNSLIPRQQLVK